jgi:hypothetical protein
MKRITEANVCQPQVYQDMHNIHNLASGISGGRGSHQ